MKSVLLTGVLICSATLCAQTIRVSAGAVDDQVFQRDASGKAAIPLSGTVDGGARQISVRIERKHEVVRDWTTLATASSGRWSGTITDLPTGGPYRIALRAGDSGPEISIQNVLVGDLWVLAGQSNMQGVGNLVDTAMPHEMVHNFDMADQWLVAEEPLHTLANATDRVHWGLNAQKQPERMQGERLKQFLATRKKGAGLGLPFAIEMVRRTGVPVGLLSCAHGGTSMDQWDPALKDKGGDSLYGSMLRRFRAAGGKVTGVLWYQGESDANPKAAPEFQRKFEAFVAHVREDFGQPELPFYYVQIGRFINDQNFADWNLVQEAQRKSEMTIRHTGMIAAIDASLDDIIHVSTPDLKRLGRRFANLACHDLFPTAGRCAEYQPGPRPVSATFRDGVVRVAFTGVNGRLQSSGRISGFSIHGADGAFIPLIYKAQLDPGDPKTVLLHIWNKLPQGATLHYGFGKDPYCNLRDSEDMALPVFGPLPISN